MIYGRGKYRKSEKILIRANMKEKAYAISAANEEGKSVSEFFRGELKKYRKDRNLKLLLKIRESNSALFLEYASIIDELLKASRKRRG